jgi:ubiquinone/menaquinone biosynthesis C-methylase UbiE
MAPIGEPIVDDIFADQVFARLYDAFNPWGLGDDFYLALARQTGGPVLDLGCGTGMLAARIAEEISPVVGADPAEGMLHVALRRSGAERVEWIEADARTLDLGRRFKLIYLTGHAFQVFLNDADALAMLSAATRHLLPDGLIAFDTRNPAARAWLDWKPQESREIAQVPGLGRVEESVDTKFDEATGIADIIHRYRFLDRESESIGQSRIRFTNFDRLAALMKDAGLAIKSCYGWWDRRPCTPDSKEIIVVASLAHTT